MTRHADSWTELPSLPPRDPDSHKGTFGTAVLIGGSFGMSGAVSLAGMSALRSGAGLVKLAIAKSSLPVVASIEPSYITVPVEEDADGRIALAAQEKLASLIESATAVGVGPGLSRSPDLDQLVAWLFEAVEKPLVVDADALNALAAQPNLLDRNGPPRILTPHPGEFARLIGAKEKLPRDQAEQRADELAQHIHGVVVLKGHRTYVTDGHRKEHNTTGNPGMATGGSGDVLTGLITALLAQGMQPWDAARLGVHIHGLAGDLAATQLGQVSMIASDLVQYLPAAFRELGS